MDKTQRRLSEAGKKGQAKRMISITKTRHELLKELSGVVKDKQMLEWIQMSKTRWNNPELQKLINHYKNKKP